MQSTAWKELLARIPHKQHNKLMLTTRVGIDIAVQDLVRVEPEYLVIRGRLAGTSDSGRLFFVPFDQISHLGIAKLIQEHEVEEIFGSPAPAGPAAPAEAVEANGTAPEPEAETPAEPEPELELEPPIEELPPRTPATPAKFPNRAELLERIRSRSQPITPRQPPKS